MLTEIAHAKINLALHVRARRDDGYHDIESLFAFVRDGDILHAEAGPSGEILLAINGPYAAGLDTGNSNLVMRAAEALQQRAGVAKGAAIHLDKRLPVASGIGGGSADAAAALRLLNRLWDLTLTEMELAEIGAPLGSDIPACVLSRTLVGTGRGEALQPLAIAGLSGLYILLVNPNIPLSTAPVFAGWDQVDRGAMQARSLQALIRDGRNDLQAAAVALVPEIQQVLDELTNVSGSIMARMSGSGATCFALFDSEGDCSLASVAIQRAHPDWWTMESQVI